MLAHRDPVRPGLWLVMELPYAAVLERPRAFAMRTGRAALILLLVGSIVAWLLGRRIARPIAELDAAAEALRGGDYGRRVHTRRRDEVGRLANTFNAMVESIERSQAELERQVAESRELAERLEQASRAKSDFLATMSHELRTPLNAITGYIDILELGIHGPLTDEQRNALERVRGNQQHLLGVITGILDFARVDARQMPYDIQEVPIESAIRDVEQLLEPQIQRKGLRYRHPHDLAIDAIVWADPTRLQQVLLNLWSNAIRFTPVGGEIWVTVEPSVEVVHVRIHDTGVGIPADKLESIFEPFVQARSGLTRPTDGTGLGLTISREFARAMGGELTAESTEGKGATFTLTLARAERAERELAS
jgi:signal transduction histidine kinase